MNAQEARAKAETFLDGIREQSLKDARLQVQQAIESAAEAGRFSVTVGLRCAPDIKLTQLLGKEFSDLGFEVSISASTLQLDWDRVSDKPKRGLFG